MDIKILYEDNDIIAAVKPAGMPAQADKTGELDILSILLDKTKEEVYLINRLDRPVGGIMVFAKNKNSAASLSLQIQNREIEKGYIAVVCGKLEEVKGEFSDFLIKNQRTNTSSVTEKGVKNSKEGKLLYHVMEEVADDEFGVISLVKIKLLTGRHHQIRVQFASRGFPLWGDSKYNKAFFRRKGFNVIGLFSSYISFKHPGTKELIVFEEFPEDGVFERFK